MGYSTRWRTENGGLTVRIPSQPVYPRWCDQTVNTPLYALARDFENGEGVINKVAPAMVQAL
jgi:hypothetical protein